MRDRALQQRRHRKARDRSLVLLLVGLILLMPPVAGVFQLDAALDGLPATLIFVFAVWALLIAGAAALAGPLSQDEEDQAVDGAPESET